MLRVAPKDLHALKIVPVRLKPWQRCALEYRATAQGRVLRYFVKVLPAGSTAPLLPLLCTLRQHLRDAGGLWDVPQPLACLNDADALVTEFVEGSAAKSLLQRAAEDPQARRSLNRLVESAAQGLAPFQNVAVPGLPVRTPASLLEDLEVDVRIMHRVAPALTARVAPVLSRLESAAARMPEDKPVLGHASFRHTHFFVRQGKPVLLDLDGVCRCGAGADPGNFLAYLDRAALRRPQWEPILRKCEEIFASALKGLPDLSPEWLNWHRAAAQLKGAMRSFSSLSTRWPETSDGLIRRADEASARLQSRHSRASTARAID